MNKDESIVGHTASNWVQPDIQHLQLCVSMKTTQLVNTRNAVVISNDAVLSQFIQASYMAVDNG